MVQSLSDNVALLPMLAGKPNAEARKEARDLLEALDVAHRAAAMPSQLSGGEQQRVAIARALINRPPLILADEPTGNLDSKSSVEIMDLLHSLHKSGVTIVMVTHEPDIAQHAERIICVRDGQTVDDGHCAEKTL